MCGKKIKWMKKETRLEVLKESVQDKITEVTKEWLENLIEENLPKLYKKIAEFIKELIE